MLPNVDDCSVTQLLHRWGQGQDEALDQLIPQIYDELRQVAHRHLRSERDEHVLQTTALVHEAYLRLHGLRQVDWASRGHFFSWVSMLMRRILIEQARARRRAKRGGGAATLSLDLMQEAGDDEVAACPAAEQWHNVVQLDEALTRLEELDPRQARVVELRFFGGFSVEQTAEALSISPATVKREWATARAWLLRELRSG